MSYVDHIRGRLGSRRIFLAFASIVLHDSRGRILLQRRSDNDLWGLPGGSLELGEDLLACARRELREETGLEAGPLRLVGVYSEPAFYVTYPNGDQVQQYTVCFQGEVSGGSLSVDSMETSELGFFTQHDFSGLEIPSWYRAMLRDALASKEPAFAQPNAEPVLHPQIEGVRAYIGHDPYIGVGAISVTVAPDGRLLLAQRVDDGVWHFPGGYLDLGENASHAAVREIYEETGLEITIERLLGVYCPTELWHYPNGDSTQAVVTIFRSHPVGGELLPDGDETMSVSWMMPREVAALPFHPLLTPLNQAIVTHLESGWFVL